MVVIRHLLFGFLCLTLFQGGPVFTQGAPQRLVKAKSVRCLFSTVASGTWNDSVVQAQTKAESIDIGFDNIDPDGEQLA